MAATQSSFTSYQKSLTGTNLYYCHWYGDYFITALCIMIDRLQKWVKCNFLSPLIVIHGQPYWRLGVSGFLWFESTVKVRLPKCGNYSVLQTLWRTSPVVLQRVMPYSVIQQCKGLRVLVHSVGTVINLVYPLAYWAWLFRLLLRGSWFVSIYTIIICPSTRSRSRSAEAESHILLIFTTDLSLCKLL